MPLQQSLVKTRISSNSVAPTTIFKIIFLPQANGAVARMGVNGWRLLATLSTTVPLNVTEDSGMHPRVPTQFAQRATASLKPPWLHAERMPYNTPQTLQKPHN